MISARNILIILAILQVAACTCNSHYYQSNGTCLQCNALCLDCSTTPTNCTSCQQSYYLANNNTCLPCNSTCISCNDSLNCLSCNSGFRLSNQKCLSCGTNCAICNQISCKTCMIGYDLAGGCTSCATGFFWSSSKNNCLFCGLGCRSCDNSSYCKACSATYNPQNGTCIYNGSRQSADTLSDDSQVKTSIILVCTFGTIVIMTFIAYIVYRCCFHQKKVKIENQSSCMNDHLGEISIQKSQSFIQEISNRNNCTICKVQNAEIIFECMHKFHNNCISQLSDNKKCPICIQKNDKPLFIDQLEDQSENNSQVSSQVTRKQGRKYEQSSNNESINLQFPSIDIQ